MNKAAQQLGRLGGKAKTKAKTEASRENGRAGGRPRRWFLDGEHWSMRALVRDSEGRCSIGRAYVKFNGDSILDLYDRPTSPIPSGPTMGWGDLSGDDMIEIGGGITHRAWLEELKAKIS
jgi:hypothetical protein